MASPDHHEVGAERVALLLRVSSEEQRERETIEIQREFLQEYCRLYNLEVAQVYADDGVSGTIPLYERPEGRRLLEDAEGGGKHFGASPYGYRTDEGGFLEVVPEEAEIVRGIIENVAGGSTLYAEAKRLNDLGLATPGWRYGDGKKRPGAKLWSVMTISNIVRQSAYSGVHRVKTNGGEDVIEQSVPPILEEPGL